MGALPQLPSSRSARRSSGKAAAQMAATAMVPQPPNTTAGTTPTELLKVVLVPGYRLAAP